MKALRNFLWGALAVVLVAMCAAFAFMTCMTYRNLGAQAETLAQGKSELPIIVLDAGHGGEDGGASCENGTLEKEINLNIALYLRDMLKVSDFTVVMTRESDVDLGDAALTTVRERKVSDLHRRADIVRNAGECILISIHQNHFSEGQYYGSQIFYSPNSESSPILAETMRISITSMLQPDNKRENKLASGDIYLLKEATCPAVIVECGFLSNYNEAEKLCSIAYQKQMAFALYAGLLKFVANSE